MKSDRERWKRELARERKKKKSKRREAAFAFHAVIIEQASDEIGQKALEESRNIMQVNGKEYSTVRLLGKGKGGYSYLASDGQREYVLKQIHHEPCDYYQFGNKMEAEMNDYRRLKEAGIRMPELLEADIREERILKEYIEGKTIYELVRLDEMKPEYLSQVRQMCERLYAVGLNIDYFPTNFVVQEKELYYIDYECNEYMEKWNFENWGMQYWSKTEEFLQYVREHE